MATDDNQKSYIRIFLRLRPVMRWIFILRGSLRAVAGGFALGMFIAFTPTIGFQVILAALFATMLNLNRPAAIITVWLTNPFTIPAIFTFNYWVGTMFFSGPPVSEVAGRLFDFVKTMASFDLWQMMGQFTAFMQLGREVLVPLSVGSVVVGGCMAVVTYFVSYRILEVYFARRQQRKREKRSSSR